MLLHRAKKGAQVPSFLPSFPPRLVLLPGWHYSFHRVAGQDGTSALPTELPEGKQTSPVVFHLSVFPHRLLHQGRSSVMCPHSFLRISAEIPIGLGWIFALSWNTRTESSPLSSSSVFHTGGGHISHHHSEFNVSTSSLCVFSLVLLLRAPCHTTAHMGGERARRILYSPTTRIPGFPKKTEYPVDVGSKKKPKVLSKKKLPENKPQKKPEK